MSSCDASPSLTRVLLGTSELSVPIHYRLISRKHYNLVTFSYTACRLLFLRAYILLILFVVCLYLCRYTSLVPAPGLLDCQRDRFNMPRLGQVYSPM